MTNKKPPKYQPSRSTRILQISLAVFSIMLILSMILSAFIIPR